MQSPSSLIFLVLLGVWAAYFVQYWIRRRDHLATARSVEQFSAAMRVLERRTPIPRTDLSDPAPRSWSVHPARATRPQVVVKRAVPATSPAPPASVMLTERLDPRPVGDGPSRAPSRTPRPVPGRAPARVRPSRRVRASVLLLAFLGSLVTVGLVGLNLVSVWAPVLAAGTLVLAFLWVRAGVRAEQAARAARRRRAVEQSRRRTSAVPVAASGRRAGQAVESTATPGTSAAPAVDEPAGVVEPVTAGTDPVEVALAEGAPERRADDAVAEPAATASPEPEPEPVIEYVHLVDEDDIPLTWDPVPVPRPTYTMKAKAERPEVAPADTTPEPGTVQSPLRSREGDLDERRAAGA